MNWKLISNLYIIKLCAHLYIYIYIYMVAITSQTAGPNGLAFLKIRFYKFHVL